jgi:hypothetical protein
MKQLILTLAAVAVLMVAMAFSRDKLTNDELGDLVIDQAERNPWNHLKLNNSGEEFQFAIVSDRTGGHRPKVFSRAVEQLNLLQPEFVLSVGDLIEGGKEDKVKLEAEWREFQGYVNRLQMPFFYVPGNHDISNTVQLGVWQEKFGKRYYHFVYRNVLFLIVDTEDPPGAAEGRLSPEQVAFCKQTLEANRGVRWTVVAMHKPIWTAANGEKTGWLDVERALAGRPYTVFCGHVHRYKRFIRNGQRYYQLATTGGSSRMRGIPYGEFDHLMWVSMKKEGPVLANLLAEGIFREDMKLPESDEEGVKRTLKPTFAARGRLLLDGKPLAGVVVVFHPADPLNLRPVRADGLTAEDGSFVLSTYSANDGAVPGRYKVTISTLPPDLVIQGAPVVRKIAAKYGQTGTSGLEVEIREGENEFRFELRGE